MWGGVGNETRDRKNIRSSSDADNGPSSNFCARTKQAAAIMRGGCNMHKGVRSLAMLRHQE